METNHYVNDSFVFISLLPHYLRYFDHCDKICYRFQDHFCGQLENLDDLLEQTRLVGKVLLGSNLDQTV